MFVGDITQGSTADQASGLYLYNGSTVVPVVRPGDSMPGGGKLQNATTVIAHSYGFNNNGDVSFAASLNLNGGDTGMYVSSGGTVRLVGRTGSVLPGIGTFSSIAGGANGPLINDSSQLLFAATLSTGDTVLILATPTQ